MSSTSSDSAHPNIFLDHKNFACESSSSSSSSSSSIELCLAKEMASSSTLSNPSALKVFHEENSQVILDPTFQDLDQQPTVVDSFFSPPRFELPLAAPWFHISKCAIEFSAWPSPLAPYIQWLNRVANKKDKKWKQLGIYNMIILLKKEIPLNFELLYGFLSL